MEPRDLLPSTRKGYESLARNHILRAIESLRLSGIRASHLQTMHADMLQNKGLSDSHSGKALEQVSACLRDAVAEGLLTVNPRSRMIRRGRRHTGEKKERYAWRGSRSRCGRRASRCHSRARNTTEITSNDPAYTATARCPPLGATR